MSVRPERKEISEQNLEILITVVNRGKADYYMDLIQSFNCNMQLVTLGQGTAKDEIRRLLGIDSDEKAVIISVISEKNKKNIFDTLEDKFRSIKKGSGIAFTVPMTSIIGAGIYGFLSNNRMFGDQNKR